MGTDRRRTHKAVREDSVQNVTPDGLSGLEERSRRPVASCRVRRGREAGRGRRPQRKRVRSAAGWEAPLAGPGGTGRWEGRWERSPGVGHANVLTLEVEVTALTSTQGRARQRGQNPPQATIRRPETVPGAWAPVASPSRQANVDP